MEQEDGKGQVTMLVVDDQEPFRDAMRELVAATAGFELVGEAASGEDALAAIGNLSPELVLMDVRMPGIGGIEATRQATDGRAASVTDFSWDDTRLAEQTGTDGRATTWAYAPGTHRPLTQTDH